MNLRQLEHVVALAEHRNFHRAAAAVGITQSALTQSIKQLEAEYGVALFKRSNRDVAATAFGVTVTATARETLRQLGQLKREIDLMKNLKRGQLIVGCETLLSEALIGPSLGRLMQQYPELRFSIRVGGWSDLLDDLLAGRIDLYIGTSLNNSDTRFNWIDIDLPPLVLAGRQDHPLLRKRSIRIEDCRDYPVAVPVLPPWYLERIKQQIGDDLGERNGISPYFLESDNYGVIRWLIRNTDAITAILPSLIANDVRSGQIGAARLVGLDSPVPAVIGSLAGRPLPPAAEALMHEVLVEVRNQWDEAGEIVGDLTRGGTHT